MRDRGAAGARALPARADRAVRIGVAVVATVALLLAGSPGAPVAGPSPAAADTTGAHRSAGADGTSRSGGDGDATCTPLGDGTLVAQVIGAPLRGPQADATARTLAAAHAGTIVLLGESISSTEQVRGLVAALDGEAPAGLPPLIAVDEEGGRVARFGRNGLATHLPSAREQARTATPAEVAEMAAGLGEQLAAHGVDWDLGPVLDMTDADPRGVIGDRSYGTDPAQVGAYAGAFAEGLRRAGLRTSGKHFPDHGLSAVDTHTAVARVEVSLAALEQHHLAPYRAALPALDSIMLSHLRVSSLDPDLPASLSPAAVRLLRSSLGFDGAVVTDDLSMRAVASILDQPTASLMALQAGVDVLLVGSPEAARDVHAHLLATLRDGRLPRERLREAVRRALVLKDVTGPAASCLLGLPAVAEAATVSDSSGRTWLVRDGRRHLVPDPETLRAGGRVAVRYADEEVAGLPEGAPLTTVRRFVAAQVSAPGSDPVDVAVARAVAEAGPGGSAHVVVAGDPAGWVGAVTATVAGTSPVLPTAEAARLAEALPQVLADGGTATVVGPSSVQVPEGRGVQVRRIDTADPVAAAVAAEEVRRARGGPADVLLVAAADAQGLTTLLPWLADDARGLLLTDPDVLDPRAASVLSAHDGPVLGLGLSAAVADAAGATPLPVDVAGLLRWLRRSGATVGDVLAHAGIAHVLSVLPLAGPLGAVPLDVDADGSAPAAAAAVGGWHLPAGATRVLFAAGVDAAPLMGLGLPPYVARPGR